MWWSEEDLDVGFVAMLDHVVDEDGGYRATIDQVDDGERSQEGDRATRPARTEYTVQYDVHHENHGA